MRAEFTVEAAVVLSVIFLSIASIIRTAYGNRNRLQDTFTSDYGYLRENHETIYDPENYLRKLRTAEEILKGNKNDGE